MKNYRININSLYYSFLYFAMSIVTIYLLISKKYLDFLTPKSLKYLVFMTFVFIVFFIYEIFQIKSFNSNLSIFKSLVIIIPISMVFIPNLGINISSLNSGYSISNMLQNNTPSFLEENKFKGETMTFTIEPEKNTLSINEANSSNSFFNMKELNGIDKENKTITVSDEEFYDWVTRIFANQDEYIGYTIKINGQVFKSPEFMNENQFVPCRLLMTCCVADTVPAGLIANYDKSKELQAGTWLEVTGKIILGEYNDQKGPVIEVTNISPGNEPAMKYVYPK